MGTTYRSGARFGPQGVRRISAAMDGFSPDMGVDLLEQVKICDAAGRGLLAPLNRAPDDGVVASVEQLVRAALAGMSTRALYVRVLRPGRTTYASSWPCPKRGSTWRRPTRCVAR